MLNLASKLIHSKEFREECEITIFDTIVHPEHGQLCQWDSGWNYIVFLPIQFKDKPAAYKWINEGTIAQLQEGLHSLCVGFIHSTIHHNKC